MGESLGIITAYEVTGCTLRKEDPKWQFALGASPVTEGQVLRIATDDGAEGFGYASATAHMGSTKETLAAELAHFEKRVVGKKASALELTHRDLDRALRGAPQAKAAIDCALHDLLARRYGIPLVELLGGPVRSEVPMLRIIPIKTPAEMAVASQKVVDKGYNYLKIKVHGEVADDVARIKAIRKQVGPKVHLTIDANQSYTPKDAIAAINRMAEYDIDLVEQPVRVGDNRGLKLVTDSVPVTVEADEAAGSLREVYELVAGEMVDAVSLKIPKLGGLRNTITAARLCEAAGVKYRLGAAVGSRLLASFGMHLACALPGIDYACELAEFERLLDDPFEGLEVVDGIMKLPSGPGTGVHRIAR
ncbi:MAG: hypothetical protein RLZ98_989 [Pseudomonadota bacterium]|jgi:L-alanine-DL-glutamate epimerase-like enolase superfamily enzyme